MARHGPKHHIHNQLSLGGRLPETLEVLAELEEAPALGSLELDLHLHVHLRVEVHPAAPLRWYCPRRCQDDLPPRLALVDSSRRVRDRHHPQRPLVLESVPDVDEVPRHDDEDLLVGEVDVLCVGQARLALEPELVDVGVDLLLEVEILHELDAALGVGGEVEGVEEDGAVVLGAAGHPQGDFGLPLPVVVLGSALEDGGQGGEVRLDEGVVGVVLADHSFETVAFHVGQGNQSCNNDSITRINAALISHQGQLRVLPLDPQRKHKLVVLGFLVGQFELLLLPPEGHPREADEGVEHFDLDDVVGAELEAQGFAVVVLVGVGVAPAVGVEQEAAVAGVLVVVELELVALHLPAVHHPQHHPRPHIEPAQLHKHLPTRLPCLRQPRPVHLRVPGLDHPVAHPEEVLVGVGAQHVPALDLPRLEDGLLRLLVVLLGHDLQLGGRLRQGGLLVLELVAGAGQLVAQLLVLLGQLVQPVARLGKLLLQHGYLGLLGLDDLTVLVLLGLDQRVELGVVHEHLLLDLGESYQDLLLEVVPLRHRVVHQLLHPVHLDEELGVLYFSMAQVQEPLLEHLLHPRQGRADAVDRLASEVEPHLDVQLLPHQEQVLLDLVHQLLDDPIHVLQHALPRNILLHLPPVLAVDPPLGVHLGDVLELVVEVVVVELKRAHRLDLLGAGGVDAQGHDLLLVLSAAGLLALAHRAMAINIYILGSDEHCVTGVMQPGLHLLGGGVLSVDAEVAPPRPQRLQPETLHLRVREIMGGTLDALLEVEMACG